MRKTQTVAVSRLTAVNSGTSNYQPSHAATAYGRLIHLCVCVCVCVKGTIIINCMHNFQLVSVLCNYCAKNTDCLLLNHSLISYSFFTFVWQTTCLLIEYACSKTDVGKSPIMGRFPNLGMGIISCQEVLLSALKNLNHYVDEVILCKHIINGRLLKTSVLTGGLCCGVL